MDDLSIFSQEDSILLIYDQIESLWHAAETWSDYVEAMRLALAPVPSEMIESETKYQPWVLLPGLCCQAAGGDPRLADAVAAAWGLLYMAAHLLDSIEDGDVPTAWWKRLGLGPAVSVATGLLASASLVLGSLRYQDVAESVVTNIMEDFHHSLLQACCGQYRDLTQVEPSLEECWQVAEAKSGVVFAVACRAGARLVVDDLARLGHYSRFGHHLGVLLQLSDDMNGVWSTQGVSSDLSSSKWTLPVAYAMDVSPPEVRARLREHLQAAPHNSTSEIEVRRLIEAAGALLYMTVEAERHYQQARHALEQACSLSAARDELVALLDSIVPLPSG